MIEKKLVSYWQKRHWGFFFLLPLSGLYWFISQTRRWLYKKKWLKVYHAPVPVIIIGNICMGGTGKTPLVLWLVKQLQQYGFSPGIISRGYKGQSKSLQQVYYDSNPIVCGDEPVLMAQLSQVPVFIYSKKATAISALCTQYPQCNIILCDDGLQHYALYRDIEIAIVDTAHSIHNRFLLPAGPLRESMDRLKQVDFVVCHGKPIKELFNGILSIQMTLNPGLFYQLNSPNNRQNAIYFKDKQCHAITGIGYPQRFFNTLCKVGIDCFTTAFKDHWVFKRSDLPTAQIILVTEKDAVKLASLKDDRIWVLPVSVMIKPNLAGLIVAQLDSLKTHDLRIKKDG